MALSPLIRQLIEAFRLLPGVGPKSAQRMAFYLLEREREGGQRLAQALSQAIKQVGRCEQCRTLCETRLCEICVSQHRDRATLCIIEGPAHLAAIEQTGGYQGVYFVLSGHLSPLDGLGPEEIGIPALMERIKDDQLKEIVLATNATVEGEATAYYIAELMQKAGLAVTRLAHGIPLGGELEYIDGGTLAKALNDRYVVE